MKLLYKIFSTASPDNCENGCAVNLPGVSADGDQVEKLLAVVFGAAAAIAILVIVFSAINFITGGGDPEKISRAKKSIIFALVGLAIAVSAETLVLTILKKI